MHIGILKFGKVTFFDKKSWSVKGGDNETCDVINMLLDDGHEVYMISMADIEKCKEKGIIPQDRKIYDCWMDFRQMKNAIDNNLPFENDSILRSLDGVIIFNGGMPNNAYPLGYNPHGLKTLQMYERYVFPPIKIFERYCSFWKKGSIYILVDNRYYAKLYDYCNPWNMSHPPKKILSQANETVTMDRKHGGPITYTATHDQIEIMGLFGRKPVLDVEKIYKFTMFQHASGIPKWRWKQLEKYVFDLPFEFNIYGDWHDNIGKGLMTEEEYMGGKFKIKNAQFNLPMPLFEDMFKTLQQTKYTFVCSKGSTAKKWSTAKYAEAIINGCIPFVARDEYDIDCVSIPKDSYMRVSDCKELQEKIQFLEDNPNEYKKLMDELVSVYCSEDRLNGKFILNKIYEAFNS